MTPPGGGYLDGVTVHGVGHLDVEIGPDGAVCAVWFGCRTLPYQVHRVTDEQEAMQRDHDPGVEIRGLHLRRSADMTTEDAEWRVSSFSGGDGCVDVAPQRDDDGSLQEVLLRHSKVPDSPVLRLSPEGWLKFCDWIRSEEAS